MAAKKMPSKDEYLRVQAAVTQSDPRKATNSSKWAKKVKRPNDACSLRVFSAVVDWGHQHH